MALKRKASSRFARLGHGTAPSRQARAKQDEERLQDARAMSRYAGPSKGAVKKADAMAMRRTEKISNGKVRRRIERMCQALLRHGID